MRHTITMYPHHAYSIVRHDLPPVAEVRITPDDMCAVHVAASIFCGDAVGYVDRTIVEDRRNGERQVTFAARIDGVKGGTSLGIADLEFHEDTDVPARLEALAVVAWLTGDVVAELGVIESAGHGILASEAAFASARELGPWLSGVRSAAEAVNELDGRIDKVHADLTLAVSDARANGVEWREIAAVLDTTEATAARWFGDVERR